MWKATLANPVWQVISGEYTDGTILTICHFPHPYDLILLVITMFLLLPILLVVTMYPPILLQKVLLKFAQKLYFWV